jgi:hypothetical protein
VNEHILAAVIANDEAEALLRVEEFDDALALANDLGRHSAASAAAKAAASSAAGAAAETSAASAAAVAATAAVTETAATAAAETSAAAAVAASLLKTTGEFAAAGERTFFAETLTLIAAASAAVAFAPSIETHAPSELIRPPDPKNQCARAKWRTGHRA